MGWLDALLLIGGGLVAGAVNSLAGGGSLLTVPLLVFTGTPGTMANGSNRIGVLVSNVAATMEFRRQGIRALPNLVPILVASLVGSLIGAALVSQLDDSSFEAVFGLLMLPLLVLSLYRPKVGRTPEPWSLPVTVAVFFGIGVYAGAFQAGVGLLLTAALLASGFDVVRANAIKVIVILVATAMVLPVFIIAGDVAWAPGLVLAAGFAGGGTLGAHLTIHRGEVLVRPIMVIAVVASATRLLGLWG
ncbi:MAG: sulfite exporter TauE/SafE family protein [Acidimicrobiales bacterium]